MALYGMENFAFGTVAAAFNNSQTTLSMTTGVIGRFTTFPAVAVLYNSTDYPTAHEAYVAGDAELIELVSKSGDNFDVIKRGQDGTSGITATAGAVYIVAVVPTRAQWLKVCRAPPDGSGPFDAIFTGTAGALTNAMMRVVKDDGANDALASLQGSDANGDVTGLVVGSTTTPDILRLQNTRLSSGNRGQIVHSSENVLTVEGDQIGIGTATPSMADGLDIQKIIQVGKLLAFDETTAEISSGAISSLATTILRVKNEGGGAGSDDLDTINLAGTVDRRALIIVMAFDTSHVITVKDGTGNIFLNSSDHAMSAADQLICLLGRNTNNTEWQELFRI